MEQEIVNRETPEIKELISIIREMTKRQKEIAETHVCFSEVKSISQGEKYQR